MKKLKISLLALTLGFIVACGNEQVGDDEYDGTDTMSTTGINNDNNGGLSNNGSSSSIVVDKSDSLASLRDQSNLQGNNQNDKNYTRRELRGDVRETGEYNSNIATPPPPNTDRMQGVPEHTYGDTANRHDGVNSVR